MNVLERMKQAEPEKVRALLDLFGNDEGLLSWFLESQHTAVKSFDRDIDGLVTSYKAEKAITRPYESFIEWMAKPHYYNP